eukprot:jgi/Botrbrau1/2975/Bobra.0026s0039.1
MTDVFGLLWHKGMVAGPSCDGSWNLIQTIPGRLSINDNFQVLEGGKKTLQQHDAMSRTSFGGAPICKQRSFILNRDRLQSSAQSPVEQ